MATEAELRSAAACLLAQADQMKAEAEKPIASAVNTKPLPDKLNRTTANEGGDSPDPIYQDELESPETSIGGGGDAPDADDKIPGVYESKAGVFSAPQFKGSYKMQYSAAPKPGFTGEDGPILIKSVILEEGTNLNGWFVRKSQFESVAAQAKAGGHLRINHSKDMQDVIGKSYAGQTIMGKDLEGYLGRPLEGVNPEGMYVTAEFEATPRVPQVRTNILQGYVDTGSIGLDADAFCSECGVQLSQGEDGEMHRQCVHLDAAVELDNVKFREYSYVAEPAFEHTKSFPAFAASIGVRLNSSLSESKSNTPASMTDTKVAVEAKVDATARKKADAVSDADADADADADSDADAQAKKYISYYNKGVADAMKFRADGDADSDSKKASASASLKADSDSDSDSKQKADAAAKPAATLQTDQIGRVTGGAPNPRAIGRADLMNRIFYPRELALADPALVELFKASQDTAPMSLNLKDRRIESRCPKSRLQ